MEVENIFVSTKGFVSYNVGLKFNSLDITIVENRNVMITGNLCTWFYRRMLKYPMHREPSLRLIISLFLTAKSHDNAVRSQVKRQVASRLT